MHAALLFPDRRARERTLENLWHKDSGAMESFIMALEVNNFYNWNVSPVVGESLVPLRLVASFSYPSS